MQRILAISGLCLILLVGCSAPASATTAPVETPATTNETSAQEEPSATDAATESVAVANDESGSASSVDLAALATQIKDETMKAEVMTELDQDVMVSYLYLDEELLIKGDAYVSNSSECADTVMLVETQNPEAVIAAMESLRVNTQSQFASYFPDEVYKFDQALIKTYGNVVAYVVCEHPEAADAILSAQLGE